MIMPSQDSLKKKKEILIGFTVDEDVAGIILMNVTT